MFGRYSLVGRSAGPVSGIKRRFYISSDGNDNNNGTDPSTAWLTIGKVNGRTMLPGDAFYFRGGDTFNDATLTPAASGTADNRIYFLSYGTGRATVTRNAASGFSLTNRDYITLSGVNFTGTGGTTTPGLNCVYSSGQHYGLEITECEVSGFASDGIRVDCSGGGKLDNVYIASCVAHDNTSQDGARGNGTAGIFLYGVYSSQDSGVYQLTNVGIYNCTAYSNTGCAGDSNWNGSGICLFECDGGVIHGCVTYDNGELSENAAGPIGQFLFDARNCIIQYGESYENKTGAGTFDGGGFDMDGGCIDCTIQYCYSHDNYGAGYLLYSFSDPGFITGCSNCTIRFCISEDDGVNGIAQGMAGIVFAADSASMSGCAIYNNTVYNGQAGSACIITRRGTGATLDCIVANNIFYSANNCHLVHTIGQTPTGVSYRGNDYYQTGGFRINWNSTAYTSFAAWQAAHNQEKIDGANVGLTSDPLLGSAGNGGILTVTAPPDRSLLTEYQISEASTMKNGGLNLLSNFSISRGASDFYSNALSSTVHPVGAHTTLGIVPN